MVMERLRNFALRKRHPRATASPFASPSAGHTLVKHDASLDPSLNLPPSVQSNSEADQDVFGVASLRSMSTQTNVKPPQANKLTQTETSSLKCPQSHQSVDDKDAEPKKLAVKPYNKKAPANEHHLVVDAHLLAMAATLIADSDTILRSGLAVSQTLDDTAQDAREAMTAINQIEGESTLLTKQMEIMQLKFNSAYVQLSNARSILRSILDHRAVANRHTVVMAGMLQSLLEIQQMITNEEGEASQWPIDRVHDILSRIDQLHSHNKYLFDFKLVEDHICATMKQFRTINFDPKYHHLLLVGMDPLAFFQEMAHEAHSFAKSHTGLGRTTSGLSRLEKARYAGSQSKLIKSRQQEGPLSKAEFRQFLELIRLYEDPARPGMSSERIDK